MNNLTIKMKNINSHVKITSKNVNIKLIQYYYKTFQIFKMRDSCDIFLVLTHFWKLLK